MPRKTRAAQRVPGEDQQASMRPRPDATENRELNWPGTMRTSGFNEAAARCHGKRSGEVGELIPMDASMRPRPDATENPPAAAPSPRRTSGFNEAAARCHGKPPLWGFVIALKSGASMRPRPDATENGFDPHGRDADLVLQ